MDTPDKVSLIAAQTWWKKSGLYQSSTIDGIWGRVSAAADAKTPWLKAAQAFWKDQGWYSGAIDGTWGNLSALARSRHEEALATTKITESNAQRAAHSYGVDERSAKNIASLHPKVQPLAIEFLRQANSAVPAGHAVKIISGTRTYAEQDALYAKGRTAPGSKVTNARAGYSNHNFGVAFDLGIFNGSDYLEDSPLYARLAPIGKALGLSWGGDWKSIKDEPHFEYPTGLTLAQMRARVSAGQSVI